MDARNIQTATDARNIQSATDARNIQTAVVTRNIQTEAPARNIPITAAARNTHTAVAARNIQITEAARNIQTVAAARRLDYGGGLAAVASPCGAFRAPRYPAEAYGHAHDELTPTHSGNEPPTPTHSGNECPTPTHSGTRLPLPYTQGTIPPLPYTQGTRLPPLISLTSATPAPISPRSTVLAHALSEAHPSFQHTVAAAGSRAFHWRPFPEAGVRCWPPVFGATGGPVCTALRATARTGADRMAVASMPFSLTWP